MSYEEPEGGGEFGKDDYEEGNQEYGIGTIKKCKDGSEWLITHWCDVCRVGLCSQHQFDVHTAGKSHQRKVCAFPPFIFKMN